MVKLKKQALLNKEELAKSLITLAQQIADGTLSLNNVGKLPKMTIKNIFWQLTSKKGFLIPTSSSLATF